MLDATDRALIALLRENARIGHAQAARRLNLSRTTVQARVESLERRGIIVGYTARLSEEISRRMVRAHVTIVVAPKSSAGVVTALQKMPELRELHSVAGVFDLLAVVEAEDVPSLDAAIDRIGAVGAWNAPNPPSSCQRNSNDDPHKDQRGRCRDRRGCRHGLLDSLPSSDRPRL